MKISFDRKEYLSVSSVFENDSLDDVNIELSEFNDDATDLAYELAYTRYALAKIEARHAALVEAVAWERECCQDIRPLFAWSGLYLRHGEGYLDGVAEDLRAIQDAARAEVDRLIGGCGVREEDMSNISDGWADTEDKLKKAVAKMLEEYDSAEGFSKPYCRESFNAARSKVDRLIANERGDK